MNLPNSSDASASPDPDPDPEPEPEPEFRAKTTPSRPVGKIRMPVRRHVLGEQSQATT